MADRLTTIYWNLTRRVPVHQRTALRTLWERALNGMPDRPFLAARRRYARELLANHSARPPALLRMAAFRKRIPSSVQTFELLGRPDLKMANVESIGTQVIFWTGDHWVSQHAAGQALWERLCQRAHNVVELGANVGYYTIAGGSMALGAYRAYEPHPRSCAALRTNLALNGIDRVTVVEAAAVPDPALVDVELVCPTGTDHAAPSGAMVKGSAFDLEEGRGTETLLVAAVPFAAAIQGCDLVKIDVEGLEATLITSSWDELVAAKPAVMIEVHSKNLELRGLMPRLLADLDAVAYAMGGAHLVPVSPGMLADGPLGSCHTWDFLIVPAHRTSLVVDLVGA